MSICNLCTVYSIFCPVCGAWTVLHKLCFGLIVRLSAHGVQLLCTPTADSFLYVVFGSILMCSAKNVKFNCWNCNLKIGYFFVYNKFTKIVEMAVLRGFSVIFGFHFIFICCFVLL